MNCPKCGKELKPGDKFCTGCGAPIGNSTTNHQAGMAGNVHRSAMDQLPKQKIRDQGLIF